MNNLCKELTAAANLPLTLSQQDSLAKYLDVLLQANERMNLTRITDRSAAEVQHIADALSLLPFLPGGPVRLADVGSGGGVPGIPLAIARPEMRVNLIESTKKKAVFLRDVVQQLGLENVTIIDQRAEAVGRGPMREKFDVVVSRAVAELGRLAEWCLPLAKVGGSMLAMKGPRVAQELFLAEPIILALGGSAPALDMLDIPELPGHLIVQIKKRRPTPTQYPRLAVAAKGRVRPLSR